MARGESGKIYIGTRGIGRVYEVTDTGGQRVSRVVVDKLVQPAGVAIKDGSLYVIAIDKVLRYDGIEKNPAVTPVDMTAVFALPRSSITTGSTSRSGPTTSSTYHSARHATSVSQPRNTRRSAVTTPMVQAWKSSRGAYAIRRASPGTR